MNCDLCLYLARVSCYHVALSQKLVLLNHSNLVSFFILTLVKSKNRLLLALLAMFITVLPQDVFEQTQMSLNNTKSKASDSRLDLSKCRPECHCLPSWMLYSRNLALPYSCVPETSR